jgi:DNA-binding transcriptional MerR regulator
MEHYTTKQLSTALDIGTSTLRKWCISLEENGYDFSRNEVNKRLFTEKDLMVLKHFKSLVQEHNFPLSNASTVVSAKFQEKASESVTPSVLPQKQENERSVMRSDETINKLLEHIERQEEFIQNQEHFNKELLSRLEKQQQYIEERLKERDKSLMENIRGLQEAHKEALASQDEENTKKSFWSKLFGK